MSMHIIIAYKMVKHLHSIEFIADYQNIGQGQGGYREEVQIYGKGVEI